MKLLVLKKKSVTLISLLFILLFSYAAISKLLDFKNFSAQLTRSPLLSNYGEILAWLVPGIELFIAFLFLIKKFQTQALWLSFSLMVMFTTYIFIILNYSSFIPCSCGGILESMDWKEHLIFNIVFITLAAYALIVRQEFNTGNVYKKRNVTAAMLTATTIFSAAIVIGLYALSENQIRYHNKLTRRFPHFPAVKTNEFNLGYNSYYIAGTDDRSVYLGNTTAQLLITVLDKTLTKKTTHHIDLDKKDLPFLALHVKVSELNFYVFDGTVPCLYRGDISNWKAYFLGRGSQFFTLAEPVSSSKFIIRAQQPPSGQSILASFSPGKIPETKLLPQILKKQMDGIFDTDGHLLYSRQLNRAIYLYTYRNEYSVINPAGQIISRNTTIDTISKAQLKIITLEKRLEKKLEKPPLYVNKSAAVYNNLMFVNSAIPGRNEELRMWQHSSIIDVYNLNDNSYVMSFYIADDGKDKLASFVVQGNNLYAKIGPKLIRYNLRSVLTKHYITGKKY